METQNNVRQLPVRRQSQETGSTERTFRVEGLRFDGVELETSMTGLGEEILQIRLFRGDQLVHQMKYDIPTHKLVFTD